MELVLIGAILTRRSLSLIGRCSPQIGYMLFMLDGISSGHYSVFFHLKPFDREILAKNEPIGGCELQVAFSPTT